MRTCFTPLRIPEHIQNYFDYAAYGRDVKIRENGVFAPGGYVAADPGAFIEYYHGPEDIPKEHRVFAYPKEAEPARSIFKSHPGNFKRPRLLREGIRRGPFL